MKPDIDAEELPSDDESDTPVALLRPGSRVQRLKSSRSYGFVLALIVASFLFTAAAPDEVWVGCVRLLLVGATLLTAIWTSGLSGSRVLPVLAGLAVAGVVGLIADGGRGSQTAANGINALLLAVTCGAILSGIVDQGAVNAQTVLGSICVYIALGMAFAFVYGAAAQAGNAAFFSQGTDGTASIRLYFSFVTLATLGYGDYTPANDFGRTLAVIEALAGQLYLVTVVALVVANVRRS